MIHTIVDTLLLDNTRTDILGDSLLYLSVTRNFKREREENNRNCESRIEGREDGEEKDR